MKRNLFTIFILLICSSTLLSQNQDSLFSLLKSGKPDSVNAKVYLELGNTIKSKDSSLFYYHQALIHYRKSAEPVDLINVFYGIGKLKLDANELDSSIYYWQQAITVFKDHSSQLSQPAIGIIIRDIYYLMAVCYYYKGYYEKAIECLQLVLNEALEKDLKGMMIRCYNLSAIIHMVEKEYLISEKYFKNALSLAEGMHDTIRISDYYNNLAALYNNMYDHSKALEYFNKSLTIRAIDMEHDLETKMNIGNTYMLLKEYKKASNILLSGLQEISKSEDKRLEITGLNLLADLYVGTHEWAKSLEYSQKSLQLLEEIPLLELKKQAAYNMSIASENLGDTRTALKFFKLHTELKDSMFNEQKSKEIDRLEAKYEFEKNERQIGELTEENLKNVIQITNDRSTKIMLLCLIGFTVLIFILVFINYQRKQEQKRHSLALNKLEIEQRMLRSQMNPHFLFNALNSIQSYITTNHNYEAEVFLSKFSLLVRNILENSTHEYISLDEEIETLKLYLELERLRFEDKFDFTIDDQLMDANVQIPPMLVQPFVENAVLHGMKGKTSIGHIQIRFKETEGDMILCEVIDDGVGRNKTSLNSNHRSLATQLTDDRIQFFNQRKSGKFQIKIIDLKDRDGSPSGTKVELLIPFNN